MARPRRLLVAQPLTLDNYCSWRNQPYLNVAEAFESSILRFVGRLFVGGNTVLVAGCNRQGHRFACFDQQ